MQQWINVSLDNIFKKALGLNKKSFLNENEKMYKLIEIILYVTEIPNFKV